MAEGVVLNIPVLETKMADNLGTDGSSSIVSVYVLLKLILILS